MIVLAPRSVDTPRRGSSSPRRSGGRARSWHAGRSRTPSSETTMRTTTLWAALAAAVLALPVSAQAAVSTSRRTPRAATGEAPLGRLGGARRRADQPPPRGARRQAAQGGPVPRPLRRAVDPHLATKRVLVHQDLGPMLRCPHTPTAGENIAYGYETPRALVSAWMHSAGPPGQHPEPALPPDRGLGLAGDRRHDVRHAGLRRLTRRSGEQQGVEPPADDRPARSAPITTR